MPSDRLRACFLLAATCALALSSCSSAASDAPESSGRAGTSALAEPAVKMPERRPDATVIIESVKWNELIVIEMPQTAARSGTGARTGSGAGFSGMAWGRPAGATATATPRLIGGSAMRFGGRGGGSQQSSEELEKLLKSGKRLRVRVPVGIPVAVSGTTSPMPEAGSFGDIRTGYRASLWLSGTGTVRTVEAVTILGKVSR